MIVHLFLRAAQENGVAGKTLRPRKDAAAKIEQLVERRRDRAAAAQIISEIDNSIAIAEPLSDAVMQPGEPLRFAMDRGYRPDPASRAQFGEFLVCGATLHSPRSVVDFVAPAPVQAASICSTRWVAVISSMRSTAAYSRTNRSSAAW